MGSLFIVGDGFELLQHVHYLNLPQLYRVLRLMAKSSIGMYVATYNTSKEACLDLGSPSTRKKKETG